MGVAEIYLKYLDHKGIFDDGEVRVMDIGAQNYYQGTREYIQDFVCRHSNASVDAELAAFAAGIESGGGAAEAGGFCNDAFLRDVMVKCGISYTSLDVFERPDNIVADLNTFQVPENLFGGFDVVLNFGTTEHVLNQFNCFEVMHDLCKTGGVMFHQVPVIGMIDHGYFSYSPTFFISIAKMNRYKIEDLWFSGPGEPKGFFASMNLCPDSARLPGLPGSDVEAWDDVRVPDGGINVLFRKERRRPFRAPLELSTAVADAAASIGGPAHAAALAKASSPDLVRELFTRLKHKIGIR